MSTFESFSMVPSLCPLETLHNNLTMKYMLEFLTRAATYKFVTPISSPPKGGSTPISLTSPRPTNTMNMKASLPSSSSSSAGPSSPTSASTPMDILTKLKIYISAQQETGNVVEPSLDSSHNTTPSNSDSQFI
ncbi:hypothetical protein KUTeg_011065 [Tegillarca granosa]|uniref:Uncharacterized protein n=1 Tax=Tegillarca granosa TaxID=220873 RepID=A0ABQ9F622_TEGGR|nr:hypothetical protein KUTeg_011065 [Tegillarca granosa]